MTQSHRWRAWAPLALGVVLAPTPAFGQEPKRCGEHGSVWMRLRTEGLSAELQKLLLTHVRSSLAARQIDLCVMDEPSAGAPLATLEVTTTNADVATDIVVDDGVTHKRVSRDLDLRGVPPDGRALTIALALDELLRASWAELMLADARPSEPVPRVVTEALAPRPGAPYSPPAHPPRQWELGAAFGGEHFGEGHDQSGADVTTSYFPWTRFGFDARLGLRAGFPVQAPRGEIRSTALSGTLGVAFALAPHTERAGLDLLGEAFVTRVTFVAESSATDVRGNEKTVFASYLVTGLRGWLVIVAPLRAFAHVGTGVPLHTAYATDGPVRITGLSGLLVTGDMGLSWMF
jgi:hypothetical protein